MEPLIYKICTRSEWQRALETGRFDGSGIDKADGYIHFSTAEQARETAAKHFASQEDLLLVAVDPAALNFGALKWEPSRGGDLFPHLYAGLPADAVVWVEPLPWSEQYGHRFPDRMNSA